MLKFDRINCLLCALVSVFLLAAFAAGCGGGGGGGSVASTPAQPEPHTTSKAVEITGSAGPASQSPPGAGASYQINFLNDYTITASDINGTAIAGASGSFTGATSFRVRVPVDNVSKILMLTVKHRSGSAIYKKIIGKMPAEADIAEETKIVAVNNAQINEDSTVKALVALGDRSKLPDAVINATASGKTDFETDLDRGLNDDDGSQYINQLRTVFNTIVKVLNSSNVRMHSVKNYFLTDLNALLNSFVEVALIYQTDDTVKQLLTAAPSVSIKGVTINSASRPADIDAVTSAIGESVSQVAAPPVILPASGLFKSALSVSMTCATPGASIRYTLDGTEPSQAGGVLYGSPFSVSTPLTIKAAAFKNGMRDSKTSSVSYTFDIPVKPSPPLVLNVFAAGASAFELKNIYDNGQPLSQTINVLNPYFEIVFRRSDALPFSLDQNPASLKIRLRATKTVNTVPIVKTFVYGFDRLTDETAWDEEFAPPAIGSDRLSFNVRAGQAHFTEDSAYNIQLLGLEGVSYTAEGAPRVRYNLPAGVAGVLNIKSGSATKVAPPIISPAGGLHISSRVVSITCPTSGALIYYTDDGSVPTANSKSYSGAFLIERTLAVNAIAVKTGMEASEISTAVFTIKTAAPVFYPAGGTYDSARQVVISCATGGARIYYTEDGSAPTESSAQYVSPLSVTASRTIKAIAVKNGAAQSDVAVAEYNISLTAKVAQPTFYPAPGSYSGVQNVIISCATPGATIKYTTDSSDPLAGASASVYSAPVPVSSTTTLKAAAVKTGDENSNVTTGLYIIKAAAPTFNPPAGSYSSAQQVVISTLTQAASIYYTTDGTEPSVASNLYNGPVTVSESLTIRAVSVKTGLANSDVAPAAYSISQIPKVASVVFNPTDGSFIGAGNVTLSCATAGAAIRYTTDGTNPSASTGTAYSAPFRLSSSVTVKAIAYKAAMADSDIVSAAYRYVPKVVNVRFDEPTKILSWDAVSVPGAAAVKYYVNGTAGAFGQTKDITDTEGTTETRLNATGLIPPEYAGIPINVSIDVTSAAVKPGGGEVRGLKSDVCNFTVTR
jgi:hypothetical protein